MARTLRQAVITAAMACIIAFALAGCTAADTGTQEDTNQKATATAEQTSTQDSTSDMSATEDTGIQAQQAQGGFGGGNMGGMDIQPGQTNEKGYTATDSGIAITDTLTIDEAFTERDLQQSADTSGAREISLISGQDVTITEEGVYVISGTAQDATIVVEASDTAKVQLVLDGVSITNSSAPAIYVKSADKVFVTLQGENVLAVTGEFAADGETDTDAVIFSKDDLCLNGTGSLSITSTEHAIVSKDDLKVTGGTYTLTAAAGSALRANDSIRIANGTFTITAEDGIKAKNDDDNELGYIYIKDGTFNITATDNGIQGYAFVRIDGGTLNISSAECIEGTFIQINDGTLKLDSSDDAINASIKSSVYTPTIEINGGTTTITMDQGDTDALDSNGYLYINGGTVEITAQSAFDYAWGAKLTGGEVRVNGEQVSEITESMMGGGMGGFGGPNNGQGGGMGAPDGREGGDFGDFDGREGGPGGRPPQGMQPMDGMEPPQGMQPMDGMEPPQDLQPRADEQDV